MTQSVKVILLEQEQRKAGNKSVGKMEKTTKGILPDSEASISTKRGRKAGGQMRNNILLEKYQIFFRSRC